jgi:response regulator of citrate/malate metabolism
MNERNKPPPAREALIMEPDAAVARTLADLLPPGASVDMVSTAAAGLQLLEKQSYRLLICADDLFDLPGLMVLAQTQDLWPAMQRILLCQDVDGEFLLHALKAGSVLHYLPKPLDQEAARNLLHHTLRQHQLVAELLASRSLLLDRELDQSWQRAAAGGGRGLPAGAWKAFTLAAWLLILLFAIAVTGFVGLYLLKSSLGIDYFPDSHLEDLLPF